MSSYYQSNQMDSHGMKIFYFELIENKQNNVFFFSFILVFCFNNKYLDRLDNNNPDDQQQISVDQQINSLKKQLEIELKVKTGAESILNTYTGQRKDTYRKMCDEAQIVPKDAKAKAEFLRMQIKRLENGKKKFSI